MFIFKCADRIITTLTDNQYLTIKNTIYTMFITVSFLSIYCSHLTSPEVRGSRLRLQMLEPNILWHCNEVPVSCIRGCTASSFLFLICKIFTSLFVLSLIRVNSLNHACGTGAILEISGRDRDRYSGRQGSWIHLSIKTDQFLWISINRSGFIDS
jgi:hypothetical protein